MANQISVNKAVVPPAVAGDKSGDREFTALVRRKKNKQPQQGVGGASHHILPVLPSLPLMTGKTGKDHAQAVVRPQTRLAVPEPVSVKSHKPDRSVPVATPKAQPVVSKEIAATVAKNQTNTSRITSAVSADKGTQRHTPPPVSEARVPHADSHVMQTAIQAQSGEAKKGRRKEGSETQTPSVPQTSALSPLSHSAAEQAHKQPPTQPSELATPGSAQLAMRAKAETTDNNLSFHYPFRRWEGEHSVNVRLNDNIRAGEQQVTMHASDALTGDALTRHAGHWPKQLPTLAQHHSDEDGGQRQQPYPQDE